MRWRPGLRPGPRWGSSRRSPDLLVGWGGGYPLPIPYTRASILAPSALDTRRQRRENRGAEGAEWGREWGGGILLPSRLEGLGERHELPQWGPEPRPPTHFWYI